MDLAGRGRGVDLLNRSLTSGLLPLQLARGAGLHAINSIAPLRQLVMRAGSEGLGPLPPLMRAPAAAAAGPS